MENIKLLNELITYMADAEEFNRPHVTTSKDTSLNELETAYIKERFPGAKFEIKCFESVDEIETKILCDDECILLEDDFAFYTKGALEQCYSFKDTFLIKRNEGEKHIYVKDVIEQLIKYNFSSPKGIAWIGSCWQRRFKSSSIPVYHYYATN